MSIFGTVLQKIANPPSPATRCVRWDDLKGATEIPGLSMSAEQFIGSVSNDMLVSSPTGEKLLPASYFGKQAQNDPTTFFGVERVYNLDEEHAAQEQSQRAPALRVQDKDKSEVANSRYLGKLLVEGPEGTGFLFAEGLPKAFNRCKAYTDLKSEYLKESDQRSLCRYEELSPLQRNLLGSPDYGEKRWNSEFSPREMKAFLVLTTLWEHPEKIDAYSQSKGQKPLDAALLQSLKVTPDDLAGITLGNIHSDRKHFEVTFAGSPEDLARLKPIFGDAEKDAKGAQTERGFLADRPFKPFHPDSQAGGGRSPDSHYSLQFMLGEGDGAGDVDMFNPLQLPSETSESDKKKVFVRHWFKHWGEIIGGKNLLPDYMKPDKLAKQLDVNLYSQKEAPL